MAHRLHHVNVIAYPVLVGHKYFAVYKNEASVRKNIAPHTVNKKPKRGILRGENGGEAQLSVVIRAATDTVYVHRGQLVLKFNHF